jgi:hypothetical protein
MIDNYGDIPCIEISSIKHITKSGTECLCGQKYQYGMISRDGKARNIIWRNINSVTCQKCKELYLVK